MKEKLKKHNYLFKAIFCFILFFSNGFFQNILVNILNLKDITTKDAVILNCIGSGIVVLLIALLYRKDLIKEWKIFKRNLAENIDIGIKYWLIGLFGMMAANLLITLIFNAEQANNEQAVQTMIDTLPYLVLLSAGIFAPISEEITFRKTFKDNIKNKILYILVSGIIFGYMHVTSANSLEQALYIIPYSSLGITFAIMYSKTNTVFTSITMHMAHNLILTILSIIV